MHLRTFEEHVRSHGMLVLAGGDWNESPLEVERSGFGKCGLRAHFDPLDDSFVTASTASTIDYFVGSPEILKALSQASTNLTSPIKQHRPVSTQTLSEQIDYVNVTADFPALPNSVPIGPRRKPPDWTPELRRVRGILGEFGLGGDTPLSLSGNERTRALWGDIGFLREIFLET